MIDEEGGRGFFDADFLYGQKINIRHLTFVNRHSYNLPDSSFLRKKPTCFFIELFCFIPRSMHFMECRAVA